MSESENTLAKFVRLQTGDDIISEVIEYEDENGIIYLLMNPLKVVYMPTNTGHLQVAFMPWVFPKICDHQEFTIHAEDVLIISNVSEYMNDYYWNNIEEKSPIKEVEPELEIEEEIDTTRRTFH